MTNQPNDTRILDLRRGGVIIHTSAGVVQYGVSPETIKDTMTLECGVPDLFLLPRNLFLEDLGLSMADLEFPIYYNFFVRGRKIRVVCDEGTRKRAEVVVREAIFGPANLATMELDFPAGAASPGFPDMKREMEYFRRNPRTGKRMRMDDLVEFLVYDVSGKVRVGDLEFDAKEEDWFVIRDRGEEIAYVPSRIYILPQVKQAPADLAPFTPPRFGMTIIGSGHGFDPNEMTSGFLLWVNGHGILVDPPVDTTGWLAAHKIDPAIVGTIILTHCHADHDAGSLQKILDKGRITVVTTRTIMESFARKYRALLDIPRSRFMKLFDFMPVRAGEPVSLFGASFTFKYTLHSIPTIMFETRFSGKSLVYTADHMNDRAFFDKLLAEGVLPPTRHADLSNFPWNHDLILHEAGMPPIHTPMAALEALPAEVKAKIRLIHVSEGAVKPGSGLALAAKGLADTHIFAVEAHELSRALEMLEALSRIDLFGTLHISRAKEFLEISRIEPFAAGETVIRRGSPADKFYIVLDGQAAVRLADGREVKVHGRHEYFGETALILGSPRTADVIARGALTCLAIGKADFLKFMRGTPIMERMVRIAENRVLDSFALLEEADLFAGLSGAQRTELLAILVPRSFKTGERLAERDGKVHCAWLIDRGRVEVAEADGTHRAAERGELVGWGAKAKGSAGRRHTATLRALSAVSAYEMPQAAFARFLDANPGLLVILEKKGK